MRKPAIVNMQGKFVIYDNVKIDWATNTGTIDDVTVFVKDKRYDEDGRLIIVIDFDTDAELAKLNLQKNSDEK